MEKGLASVLKLNFNKSLKKELEPLGELEELDSCSGMYIRFESPLSFMLTSSYLKFH